MQKRRKKRRKKVQQKPHPRPSPQPRPQPRPRPHPGHALEKVRLYPRPSTQQIAIKLYVPYQVCTLKSCPCAKHHKFFNFQHTFSYIQLWHNFLYFLSFLDIFSIDCTLSKLFKYFMESACNNTLSIFEKISLKKNIKLTCCCHETGLKPVLFAKGLVKLTSEGIKISTTTSLN